MRFASNKEKVFVTGATGFIGSHLIPKLVERGYRVYAIKRHISRRDAPLPGNIDKFYTGDLTDSNFVEASLQDANPDFIINLAAQSLVAYSFERWDEVTRVDYLAAANLMQLSTKLQNLKAFVQASTSEVYGYQTVEEIPIKEDAPKRPHTPYPIAKHAADCYAKYLRLANNFPYILIRNFNTYGEKFSTRRVTERAIAEMLKAPNNIRMGSGTSVRDFLYVDDSIDAYLVLLENWHSAVGEEWNVCTGVGITVRDWVHKIAEQLDWKGTVTWDSTYKRPTGIPILIGNGEKIRQHFDWKPRTTHELGLQHTIGYVKDYLHRGEVA